MALPVQLVVFSQTGATLAVADAMQVALEAEGHPVTILPTTLFGPDEVEVDPEHLLAVGTPTFFSRAPVHVRRFVSRLAPLTGTRAIVFATSAGASGRVLADLREGLEDRGAEVIGGSVFRGEVHFPAPAVLGRASGRPDRADLHRAGLLALAAARHVEARTPGPLPLCRPAWAPLSRPDSVGPARGFYATVGRLLTPTLVRRVLPAPVVDPERCTRCGWCRNHCPVDAITFPEPSADTPIALDGRRREPPEIGPECIRCLHCTACPVDAYTVDWRIANPIVGALYHPALVERFGDLERGEQV